MYDNLEIKTSNMTRLLSNIYCTGYFYISILLNFLMQFSVWVCSLCPARLLFLFGTRKPFPLLTDHLVYLYLIKEDRSSNIYHDTFTGLFTSHMSTDTVHSI